MTATGQVAIITGGASGMGLAVVEDLAAKGWNITVFDFDHISGAKVAERLGRQVSFIKGNTAKMFEEVFANAGIGERSKFYEPKEELAEGFPPKPSTLTLEVNLLGVVYTAYLALHFFRKNATKSGKLVMTSSASALYPSGSLALYSAAKHAVVGLTRSMGAALGKEPITVNCICPGLVPSGLLPEAFTNALQADMITPRSTIVKAINNFLADDSLTGQVAECSGQDVIYRPSYEPENEAARYMLALQDGKVAAKIDLAEMGRHAKVKEFYDRMEESAT
ncbi:hypothetical protein CLCR_02998 [Cladophialophora carrionii]|uniref:15-hydroxyprostaglandin dehydrogenase [NAD(+)] n=1 Tax=Cladophialophora carrionii TaxID=86049 RepID=A0A1C1D2I8_9EURO|nr:hypothetical protein CLCR_02998 [Cladophialophora carrionii]